MSQKTSRLAVLFASLSLAALAHAGDDVQFHDKVRRLYSFSPSTLSQDEVAAKSKELDRFWTEVKADPDGLALLRKQLAEGKHSTFFQYDGAKLLLDMSKDRRDRALALQAIAKADLKEITGADYVRTVQSLAAQGLDTREAAFRVLDYPEFFAVIPQHALTLEQDFALIYMLFPMEESVFVGDLAKRLSPQDPLTTQKSLMKALWYTCTRDGRAALEQVAAGAAYPEPARAWARELLDRQPDLLWRLRLSSVDKLRTERRTVMSRPISDEALTEFDHITAQLLGAAK